MEEASRPAEAVRAALWEEWRGGPRVHCFLCAHHCRIAPGERGRCGVRENRDGVLYTLVYGCPVSTAVDPIEKKPLFHFLPGSMSFSLATVGCNFTCSFCQNADISQMPRDQGRIIGRPPLARTGGDPRLWRPGASASPTPTPSRRSSTSTPATALVWPTAAGLKNVFVTNGYMTAETLRDIDGHLHAANVDLKSFSDEFYRTLVGARLKPVLDSIRRLWQHGGVGGGHHAAHPGPQRRRRRTARSGLVPGLDLARHPLARVSLPSHLSVCSTCRPPRWRRSRRALRIGREEGLRYVYGGNIPGHSSESTVCPACGELVIERQGFRLGQNLVNGGRCPRCGRRIAGLI